MEKLLEILEGVRPDIDFKEENALMDDGILDSFDVVTIISELNDAYDIHIKVTELNAANFNSMDAIMAMVNRLQKEN